MKDLDYSDDILLDPDDDDDDQHPYEPYQQMVTCASCKKALLIKDCVINSCHPYHKNCIKCIACNETGKRPENLDDFVSITPGLLLCSKHFSYYLNGGEIPANIAQEIHKKKKENFINELFNPPIFTNEDILNHPREDIFITKELVDEMIQYNKPYEVFIPTITLHFDKEPEKVDYEKLIEFLNFATNKKPVIVNVERGSVLLKVAFLSFLNISKDKFNKIIAKIKDKLCTPFGKSVAGNLVDEPEINNPDNEAIRELYNKPSINILQNTDDLDDIEIEDLKKVVFKKLVDEKNKQNWSFIFAHKKLLDEAEEQIRRDIRNNQFEMIIVGQTIFANKYFNEYEIIKKQIPSEDIVEHFLYHGSQLKNHQKILNEHFLMPGEDEIEEITDKGYYGKGIYATDNLFYASLYANGFEILSYNKKSYVICCKVIYNNSMVSEIKNLSLNGKEIDKRTKNNYGINHSFVGSSNRFKPISKLKKEESYIYGEEFVFPNKYQIIPICTLTVMRKDHYILWKDDNIENDENSNYLKDLSQKMEVNLYRAKTVDEALKIIQTKKRSKIKLITNAGSDFSGRELIEKARKITHSNFVCLVFTKSTNHLKWVSTMENVLLTTDEDDFKKFAELKMNNRKSVLDFAEELSKKYNYRFKIKEDELLNFPDLEILDKFTKKLLLKKKKIKVRRPEERNKPIVKRWE